MSAPKDFNLELENTRYLPREALAANSSAMVTKVVEDIRFLRDRIERIKKLHTPNSTVLKTYESMLASREAVLSWLRENGELNDSDLTSGLDDVDQIDHNQAAG